MTLTLFIILAAVVAEVIALFIYATNKSRYNLILSTETSGISTLGKGFYEVKGKVSATGGKLSSPYSNKPCVYYRFKVEEHRSSGKSSHWHTLIDDVKHLQYGVTDSGGTALINMEGADIRLNRDDKGRTGFMKENTPELKSAMTKYSQETKGWLFEKSLRFEETFLCEGDELYVLGEVRDFSGYYPVFSKDKKPLIISDKPEESLLKTARVTSQVALFFLLLIPAGLGIYIYYHQMR